MTDELRRTAGRWRTGESSPLGTFAATGTVVPGADDEIRQNLEIVERGGLAFAEFDPLEEYEELRDLLEHVELELALGEARQVGSLHGTNAAVRWQSEIGGTAALGATTANVLRFMEAVEERDPGFVDALPVPASDFTVSELARRSGWHEPDPSESRAHDRWSVSRDELWDAYEVAFYEATHQSVARWRLADLVDASATLDQPDAPSLEAEAPRPWRSLRVQIVDDDALGELSPQAIQLHLSRRGWQRAVSAGNRPDIWELRTPDGSYGVLAPTTPTAPDYPLVVRELLRTLSIVEDRSELDIFRDLDPTAYAQHVGRGPVSSDAAATLRKLAEARRDYAYPAVPAGDRTIILQEAAVMERVADALSGRARWDDLVAGYAPSWRWHEFADHDPQLTLPPAAGVDGSAFESSGHASPVVPGASAAARPYLRAVADSETGLPATEAATPPGWRIEPVGVWRGAESEVVYDPRRFEVLVSESPSGRPDQSAAVHQATGWEQQATDGPVEFWVLDRVAATRAALARIDQHAAGVQINPSQLAAGSPPPEVQL